MRRKLVDFPLKPEDMSALFGPSNELTVRSWDDRWLDNAQRNLYMFPDPQPCSSMVYSLPNHHTVMICGAGWTLRKLKPHASMIPKSWGILATDRSLAYLLDLGIKPSVVVTMDGNQEEHPRMQEAFDRLKDNHPDVPVLVDLVTCPTIVKRIKNPYFFRSSTDPDCKVSVFLNEYLEDNPQVKVDVIGHGGNVGSVATIIAKFFFFARHVVLVGFNFSMAEGTMNVDSYEQVPIDENTHALIHVSDVYGRPIRTMANLHNYRTWQEYFCYNNDEIEWINANDGGFLGVHSMEANYNHYTYETIAQAIERLGDHGLEDH